MSAEHLRERDRRQRYAAKLTRLGRANALLIEIASCGRRFFHHKGRVSQLDLDERGRVWLVDKWTGNRIYTHYAYLWRGFSEGGTLRELVCKLRDYIVRGDLLPPLALGPYHSEMINGGDIWGYGEDMERVRAAARRLGVIKEDKP